MKGIYFEEKGEELLETLGISKSEFARMMGIHRQNVKALFRTHCCPLKVVDVVKS